MIATLRPFLEIPVDDTLVLLFHMGSLAALAEASASGQAEVSRWWEQAQTVLQEDADPDAARVSDLASKVHEKLQLKVPSYREASARDSHHADTTGIALDEYSEAELHKCCEHLADALREYSQCFRNKPPSTEGQKCKVDERGAHVRSLEYRGKVSKAAAALQTLAKGDGDIPPHAQELLGLLAEPQMRFALMHLLSRASRLQLLRSACSFASKINSKRYPWLLRALSLSLTRTLWSEGARKADEALNVYQESSDSQHAIEAFQAAVYAHSPRAKDYLKKLENAASNLAEKKEYVLGAEINALLSIGLHMLACEESNPAVITDNEQSYNSRALSTAEYAVRLAKESVGDYNPFLWYCEHVLDSVQKKRKQVRNATTGLRYTISLTENFIHRLSHRIRGFKNLEETQEFLPLKGKRE